jgi:hypothetical protein
MTFVAVATVALVGGVAVAATSSTTVRTTRTAASTRATTTTVPSDAADEDATDVDETGPFAVRTITVQLYDAARDRTISITVYAPDTTASSRSW